MILREETKDELYRQGLDIDLLSRRSVAGTKDNDTQNVLFLDCDLI
jgi:hypothetical protein